MFTCVALCFDVQSGSDGGYSARCLDHDIFTQADSLDELAANIREAVEAYFFDQAGEYTIEWKFNSRDPVLVLP